MLSAMKIRRSGGSEPSGPLGPTTAGETPGKRTLVQAGYSGSVPTSGSAQGQVQLHRSGAGGDRSDDPKAVHDAATRGTSDSGGPLPHLRTIQALFGRHDVRQVQAHTGAAAAEASHAMGAEAFATGNHVAFAGSPSLHTAAHEAAHVVQ